MPIQKFTAVMKSSRMITPSVLHMTFGREDGQAMEFVPGQFITFLMHDQEGNLKRRSYSIATMPGQSGDIELAVSFVKGGVATDRLFHMQPGETLSAIGPAGKLVLLDEPVKRYILVGTGTGIAPYRAMLPVLAEKIQCDNTQVVVVEGVQYRQDLLYGEDFVQFQQQHSHMSYRAHFSRDALDAAESHEHKGYVHRSFDALDLNPEEDVVYLCGNPDMIDDAFADLSARGFESKRIRREKYISSN